MLRGRRLLLPQSPLSGWITTASTTTAPARQTSHFTSGVPDGLRSDHSTLEPEVQPQDQERELAKQENGQDLQGPPDAKSQAETTDPRAPRPLTFRKFAVDSQVSLDGSYVYAKVPNRYRTLVSSEDAATSASTQVDLPQLPLVKGDAASHWTEGWVRKVGKRIGLRLSKRDSVYFKLSIARYMGLKPSDPRLASPAMALAAIEQFDRLVNKISTAKARLEELSVEGKEPAFMRRDFECKGDSTHKSKEARLRWDQLEAEGKAPISLARKKETSAQLAASDLVGADLRDSLRDNQTCDHDFTGRSEPTPQTLRVERAPPNIRFTVRPTWLPFDHSSRQARKSTTEQGTSKRSSEGGPDDLLIPKAGGKNQQLSQSATDMAKQPTGQLGPFAVHVPMMVAPEQPHQASLNETPKPRGIQHNIYNMLFPQTTEPEPRPSQAQGSVDQKPKLVVKRREKPATIRGGIYKKLFPDDFPEGVDPEPRPQPGETEEQTPPNEEDLVPPEESIFVSLRNEVRNWIPEEQRKEITAPEPGEYGSHSTVLVLSGLSNSLIDSDFYRILPETKHIEGWAGGLVKVVQARDALSHEPVGRYFLMFHSRPAADAYKAELLRLHSLSKRLLHSSMGTGPLADALPNPQPFLTDEEKAAVRSFTLCPPTAPLVINVHIWNTNLFREIAQSTKIADVVQALRPDVATPSKVLVTVNTIPGSKAGSGGGLTTDELWLTLRDDGRERGAPWVLSNLKEGIMPVKLTTTSRHGKIDIRSEAVQASLEGPIYDELDMIAEPPPSAKTEPIVARKVAYDAWHGKTAKKDEIFDKTFFFAPESTTGAPVKVGRDEKFNRFVVTFTQPTIAKRFVRSWHKRAIWDAYEKRSVTIDALSLM